MKAFDYTAVPNHFKHCMHDECPQKVSCLRYRAYEKLPADTPSSIYVINPKSRPYQPEGSCPSYLTAELTRYGKGMKSLFDNVPHVQVKMLKTKLIKLFGETSYYRSLRGDSLIGPEKQAMIKALFNEHGVDVEVNFDEYVENYKWTE